MVLPGKQRCTRVFDLYVANPALSFVDCAHHVLTKQHHLPTIPTETLTFSAARPQLSRLPNRVFRRETRVVIAKHGIRVAALVSLDDLRRLEAADAQGERDVAALDAIGAAFAHQTPEEIARETAMARARAALRAERAAAVGR